MCSTGAAERYYVLERAGRRMAQIHLWILPAAGWDRMLRFREVLRNNATDLGHGGSRMENKHEHDQTHLPVSSSDHFWGDASGSIKRAFSDAEW